MIEINNLTVNPVSEDFLKKVAKTVFRGEKLKERQLSIALVGQERIRELNKRYRGKDRATDILAFPETKVMLKKSKPEPFLNQGLGEIVICLREVKKNAKRFSLSFENELARVLIHGILHLLGYDHEKSEKEADKMRKKEEYYLSQILKFKSFKSQKLKQ